jgi:hypothetical protein
MSAPLNDDKSSYRGSTYRMTAAVHRQLLLNDLLNRRTLYELRQRDSLEKTENLVTQLTPELVSKTPPPVKAIFLTRTACCVKLLINGADDIRDRYAVGASR